MMLVRLLLPPVLLCTGASDIWVTAHSSVAKAKDAGETGFDAGAGKHGNQAVRVPVLSVSDEIGDGPLKGESRGVKLPALPSFHEGHTFSFRRPASAKSAHPTGVLFGMEAGKDKKGNLFHAETFVREEKVKPSAPGIGSRIPLPVAPVVGGRCSGAWQSSGEHKGRPGTPECMKEREHTPAEEVTFIHPDAPPPKVYAVEDVVRSNKSRPTLREVDVRERVIDMRKEGRAGLPREALIFETEGRDHKKVRSDSFQATPFHQRSKCGDGNRSCTTQGSKSRFSGCETFQGASNKDCAQSRKTDGGNTYTIFEESSGNTDKILLSGNLEGGSVKLSDPVLPTRVTSPAKYTSVLVREQPAAGGPCLTSSCSLPECVPSQQSSGAAKGECRHSVVRGKDLRSLLTHEETKSPPHNEVAKTPDVAVVLKPRIGRSAACKCAPTCRCPASEEGIDEEGSGGSAEPLSLGQHSITPQITVDGADEDDSLADKMYTEIDQVKVVRGTLPVLSGARVRGEPSHPGKGQLALKPTSQPARSPTQHHVTRPSASVSSTPPLAQLEELFLNVGEPFVHHPVATEVRPEGVQSRNPLTIDDTAMQQE